MVSRPRHPRGQQRDKPYREALCMELAAMSEGDLKKLCEIIDMHAIKPEKAAKMYRSLRVSPDED